MNLRASLSHTLWHGLGLCAITASGLTLGKGAPAGAWRLLLIGGVAHVGAYVVAARWSLRGAFTVGAPILLATVIAATSKMYGALPLGLVAFFGITSGSMAALRPRVLETGVAACIVASFFGMGADRVLVRIAAVVAAIVFTAVFAVLVRRPTGRS